MARKLFLRELKELKTIRKLSASAVKKDVLIKSSIPDLVIPEVNFLDQLWENSHRWDSAHVALKCAETHKSYTYAELWKNIAIFGTSLKKKFGLQPNDIVAAMLPNCPEYPVAAFGTLKAGGVMTTINPIYKEFEITHQISLTNPKIVITIPECYETVRRGLQNAKNDAKVIILDRTNKPIPEGTIRFSEVAENGEADYALLDKVERKLDDVAFIPFSSGTTGLPKGVEVTHRNLVAANLIMHHERVDDSVIANGSYQEVLPCFLPFFHIYGLVINLIGHVAKGCKLVTMPKFSASTFFNILKNENPTVMYVVPPIVLLLGKHPDVTKDHLKSLRRIICGAAPLSSTDVEGVLEKTEGKLVFGQGYGATETCALASTTFIGRTVLDNSSCGEVMANTEMKFVEPTTGEDLAIGDQGELLIRSPTVMKGYYKNEKATKDSITEDGFFRTGDLGYYKPNVGLYITDRIKELIKVKGMQVAPAELESLLRTHPAVQDAAVIGVPHEYHGEVPKAFIIKKSGQDTTPEQLQDFVARQVAAFKKIEEVVFVNDIPKTNTGKILRKDLKKMYA
ncbi:4-coumarate--CoA ligase 2-like [Pieris napi]|uniref:4-coumarate--CoA ligase 2-like n=1 Tax=Pieris napi TaxID=78633 RepID=UPI001FB97B2E|nr:4-coumarate--CoA ligase 2-like [Pieris napi]